MESNSGRGGYEATRATGCLSICSTQHYIRCFRGKAGENLTHERIAFEEEIRTAQVPALSSAQAFREPSFILWCQKEGVWRSLPDSAYRPVQKRFIVHLCGGRIPGVQCHNCQRLNQEVQIGCLGTSLSPLQRGYLLWGQVQFLCQFREPFLVMPSHHFHEP